MKQPTLLAIVEWSGQLWRLQGRGYTEAAASLRWPLFLRVTTSAGGTGVSRLDGAMALRCALNSHIELQHAYHLTRFINEEIGMDMSPGAAQLGS
jgi:hypothetical protein